MSSSQATCDHKEEERERKAGFYIFVVLKPNKEQTKGREREQMAITPNDTQASLKRKRNNDKCEFPGCTQTENTEWHHHTRTWLGPGVADDKSVIVRPISNFKPTENQNTLDIYAAELAKTTLLCQNHHRHTHTTYCAEKSRLCQKQAAARRLAVFEAVKQQYGTIIAARVLQQYIKLGH